MAIKSQADLTSDNSSQILSAVVPDSITNITVGGILQDIIDSMINQNDLLVNGVPLSTYVNNLISIALSTTGIVNGLVGQFSVSLAVPQAKKLATLTEFQAVVLLNESENGCFDNGNNFHGSTYIAPPGGFTGKFQITDCELENLVNPTTTDDVYEVAINKYDSAGVLLSTLVSKTATITTGMAANTKVYVPDMTTASVTIAAGEKVRADIRRSTGAVTGTGVININSLMFNNHAL